MYVGIDIGGTTTRLAQSLSLEKPTLLNRIEFSTSRNFESDYIQIANYIHKIKDPVEGIGIGIAGRVDKKTGLLTHSNNLPHYIDKPFLVKLRTVTNAKINIANDGIASTFAEAFYSTNNGKSLIYITWGTGIAVYSLSYIKGKPTATKLDRTTFYPTWESDFSGSGIYKKFGRKAESIDITSWKRIFYLFEEELRRFILKEKPKLIIFGGGLISKQWGHIEVFVKKIKKETGVKAQLTSLGENVGLYGAFALLRYNRF